MVAVLHFCTADADLLGTAGVAVTGGVTAFAVAGLVGTFGSGFPKVSVMPLELFLIVTFAMLLWSSYWMSTTEKVS